MALFKMAKISELPIQKFISDDIDNCFYIEDMNQPTMKVVRMQSVFDWIKDEANKNGLTVKMTDERIMFISGNAT
jgi:hypothetical protein